MEMLAALLARDLFLPVPDQFFVEISTKFAEILPDTHKNLAQSSSQLAFGSKLMTSGFATWPLQRKISQQLHAKALAIFAFDAITLNPDRRTTNPNCLARGEELRIIDHELCFMSDGIIGWKPPWELGGLNHMQSNDRHIFYNELKGRSEELTRGLAQVQSAWSALHDARLQAYIKDIPPEWVDSAESLQNAIQFLQQARKNIGGCIQEIRRVLT